MQCCVVTENSVVSKNLPNSNGAVTCIGTYMCMCVCLCVCIVHGSYAGLALPALKERRSPGVEQRWRTPSVAWAANEKNRAPRQPGRQGTSWKAQIGFVVQLFGAGCEVANEAGGLTGRKGVIVAATLPAFVSSQTFWCCGSARIAESREPGLKIC